MRIFCLIFSKRDFSRAPGPGIYLYNYIYIEREREREYVLELALEGSLLGAQGQSIDYRCMDSTSTRQESFWSRVKPGKTLQDPLKSHEKGSGFRAKFRVQGFEVQGLGFYKTLSSPRKSPTKPCIRASDYFAEIGCSGQKGFRATWEKKPKQALCRTFIDPSRAQTGILMQP